MGQVDLANIKDQIKSIFDAANTTTGSPIDLSAGLDRRIKAVLKVNPDRVPIQADFFPWITIFCDTKEVEQVTMGHGSQASSLRQGDISMTLFAAVDEPFVTDILESQADENIERLMENVEEVLRSNPSLNNSVKWSVPGSVTYHTVKWDGQEANIRAAVLDLNCRVYY